MNLEQRLEKLEQRNRWLMIALLLMAVGIVYASVREVESVYPDQIYCSMLTVGNPFTNTNIELEIGKNTNGNDIARVDVNGAGGTLRLFASSESTGVMNGDENMWISSSVGGFARINDVYIEGDRGITVGGLEDKAAAFLGYSESKSGHLEIRDENGTLVALMSMGQSLGNPDDIQYGVVKVFDPRAEMGAGTLMPRY